MKKFIALILGITMILSLVSCANNENKEPETAEPSPTDLIAQRFEEITNEANDAGSMWELLCRLFPDYVIFKDSVGNFTHAKVDQNLKLNTYDWSSLAGTIKGIDVSSYQGTIDWAKVASSGINYSFIRCGYRGYAQGVFREDEKFERNITEALKNDIKCGVYFVTKALSVEEAIEEAEWVVDLVKPYNITYPIVIDIEPTSVTEDRTSSLTAEERTQYVLAFCDAIEKAGYTPMIYGNVGTFMKMLEFDKLEGVEKWFAQYFNEPYLRYEFGVWQASSTGSVPGIKGNVDIDYSLHDYSNEK